MKGIRAAGLAGIVSVLLVVGDALAAGNVPRETASTQTILTYYASSSHWHRQELALILGALSMIFFLAFLGALSGTVRSAERAPGWVAGVVLAAGAAFAVLFAGLSTLRGTIAFALDGSHAFRSAPLDPQLVRALETTRSLFYLHALIAGAIMIAASSLVAMRARLFPAALGWGGLAVAVLLVIGAFVSTAAVFLLLLWIVVVGATLSLKANQAAT